MSSPEEVADASRRLAARPGAIVPLQATRVGVPPNLDLLLDEVTISTNTTAAGGNASLMAIA